MSIAVALLGIVAIAAGHENFGFALVLVAIVLLMHEDDGGDDGDNNSKGGDDAKPNWRIRYGM